METTKAGQQTHTHTHTPFESFQRSLFS